MFLCICVHACVYICVYECICIFVWGCRFSLFLCLRERVCTNTGQLRSAASLDGWSLVSCCLTTPDDVVHLHDDPVNDWPGNMTVYTSECLVPLKALTSRLLGTKASWHVWIHRKNIGNSSPSFSGDHSCDICVDGGRRFMGRLAQSRMLSDCYSNTTILVDWH